MRYLSLVAMSAFLASVSPAWAQTPPQARPVPADRVVLPTRINPLHYDIDVDPDAPHSTFVGAAKIDVAISEPTYQITLNAVDLDIRSAQLSAIGGTGQGQSSVVSYDKERQTATLTFPGEVPAGRYQLALGYAGKINDGAAGLFHLDYDNHGRHQRALFTQFESADARRFVPCWDEPNKKATFTVSTTVPAGQMAVSNMPVVESTPGRVPGTRHVRFETTPRMSTYLLFLGQGDFERVSRTVDGVDVGVVVKRGDLDQAAFALDTAVHVLGYLNDYFGYKYPLPKMDLIAAPGASQAFSAMENWGALLYFERAILVDPRISTEGDRQNVYVVIAHEMAHQWFGDLVTMDWWDDLWLNEGFASWMEVKATDHFHPEWHLWLGQLMSKQSAMGLDARVGSHPVIQPIQDVLQSDQAFDVITYDKGEAVIAMLEAYVGEQAFRSGVRNYIRKYAFGNTVTDDLWKEVDAVSPLKITDIAHDFTLREGVPLLRVERQKRPTEDIVTLDQDRFGLDEESKAHRRWQIPVVARPVDDSRALTFAVVDRLEFGKPGAGPFLINAGQHGYFRTLYHNELFAELVARFDGFTSADQLGILNDTGSLANAGYQPEGDMLALLARVPVRSDPIVVTAMVRQVAALDKLLEDLPSQGPFRVYGRRRLGPVLEHVGWDPKPGESDNVASLRELTLTALARFGDTAVVGEARQRFQSLRREPHSLSAATRRTVLQIVAEGADASTWDELHALARAATTPLEKLELYNLLGASRDRAIAARGLELAFSPEVEVSNGAQILSRVGERHPELAFDYGVAHLEELNSRIEPDVRYRFLSRIVAGSHDPALLERLHDYAEKNIPANARLSVVQADSSVTCTLWFRAQRAPDIATWLASHGGT